MLRHHFYFSSRDDDVKNKMLVRHHFYFASRDDDYENKMWCVNIFYFVIASHVTTFCHRT